MDASELTAPVRARDRRIEELEDLVHDLMAIGPERKEGHPHVLFCRWCIGVQVGNGSVAHEVDCPVPRAERALRR